MSKNDQEKWRPTLTYPSTMRAIARVRALGIAKYGSAEDWLTTEPQRHFDAALRHIIAHLEGEYFDGESGELHIAHAITNLMFEVERIDREVNGK